MSENSTTNRPEEIKFYLTLFRHHTGWRFLLCKDHHPTFDAAVECLKAQGNGKGRFHILEVTEALLYATTQIHTYDVDGRLISIQPYIYWEDTTDTFPHAFGLTAKEIRERFKELKAAHKQKKWNDWKSHLAEKGGKHAG